VSGDLAFPVFGTPAPQGSKRHVGHGVMVESGSARLKPWREAVKTAALDAIDETEWQTLTGPVHLLLIFQVARPLGHFGTGRNAALLKPSAPLWPGVRPDLDKLTRSTCDALKDAGVYRDDSLVVMLDVSKVYATGRQGAFIRATDLGALETVEIVDVPVQGGLL
jgi:crossover junction endodeoxyribonuclease RusA